MLLNNQVMAELIYVCVIELWIQGKEYIAERRHENYFML